METTFSAVTKYISNMQEYIDVYLCESAIIDSLSPVKTIKEYCPDAIASDQNVFVKTSDRLTRVVPSERIFSDTFIGDFQPDSCAEAGHVLAKNLRDSINQRFISTVMASARKAKNILYRKSKPIEPLDIVDLINCLERYDLSTGTIIMHAEDFELSKFWQSGADMQDAKEECKEIGKLLGKNLILSESAPFGNIILIISDIGKDAILNLRDPVQVSVRFTEDRARIRAEVLSAQYIYNDYSVAISTLGG